VKTKPGGISGYLAGHEVKLVVTAGPAMGRSFPIVSECMTIGRGPGVDMVFDNPEMSRQHCAIEFSGGGFRIRDLGSTNGIVLNGRQTTSGDLKHGYRFEIGSQCFQLVVESKDTEPDTYELTGEM
jgi:pSer/pThr/pTyr-binding forkhead associated (FHA) protein